MSKDTKTDRIGMRVNPEQKLRWEKAAMARGFKSLAAWITATLEDELLDKQYDNDKPE